MNEFTKMQAITSDGIELVKILYMILLGLLALMVLRSRTMHAAHKKNHATKQHEDTTGDANNGDDDFVFPEQPQQDHALFYALKSSCESATIHDPPFEYIPLDALETLITQQQIESELRKIEEDNPAEAEKFDRAERAKLAFWVVQNARRIFAISLQCDLKPNMLLYAMRLAKKYQFTDVCLPAPEDPNKASPPWPDRFHYRIWDPRKLEIFNDKQWMFDAAIFDKEILYYDFPARKIFPFKSIGVASEDGTFSRVYQVKVHDAHHNFSDQENIALKELRVQNVPMNDEQREILQAWENEAGTLEAINGLNHNHIIKCIAAIRRGNGRYFMFPWATGRSLRDFWDKTPRQPPSAEIILQVITQLRGIADALDELHNFEGGRSVTRPSERQDDVEESSDESDNNPAQSNPENPQVMLDDLPIVLDNEVDDYRDARTAPSIRHGDLKPENILRFVDNASQLGTLRLADMGLAKRHVVATQLRSKGTNTRWSTRQYEAPEALSDKNARSRLYDVWSMGCITLEFIIWILYGNAELGKMYSEVKGLTNQIWQYYKIVPHTADEPGGARVHPVVNRWVNYIDQVDPECKDGQSSAIKDLLAVVREKLLVVPLPPDRISGVERGRTLAPSLGSKVTHYRATAAEFRDALDSILAKADQKNYLFTGQDRSTLKPPSFRTSFPSKLVTNGGTQTNATPPEYTTSTEDASQILDLDRPIASDYALPKKGWQFEVDNAFAEALLREVGWNTLTPSATERPRLCRVCSTFNFWKGGFSIEEKASKLASRAASCQLCALLHSLIAQPDGLKSDLARFERDQSSTIVTTDDSFPVLSLVRTTELNTQLQIQLGFPALPQAGSQLFYSLLKQWLVDCDDNHEGCRVEHHSLPTRLIDVGSLGREQLRLIETATDAPKENKYVALSHPWGDPKNHKPFMTLRTNVLQHKQAIPEADLPLTFKHAVECARNLGVRYLWIDSICIIQGSDGDFNLESKNMEKVFSGAYCVLAASRATGQHDGFIGGRPPRSYIPFQHDHEPPFYICKTIDNFSADVIDGALNRRGWVLQERILARRTIYFTATQTYFECGAGVRCETLTKKRNKMVEYLSDPNFPARIMDANRGSKISAFQELYRRYSRLDFSHDEDRPFAIAGLEARLQRALMTKGDYGIFDDGDTPDGGLFHRSLLWKRGEDPGDREFMTEIEFSAHRDVRIPSWSWMGYKGGIDYVSPPGDSVEWETQELHPPWTGGDGGLTTSEGQAGSEGQPPSHAPVAISALARPFDVRGRRHDEVKLYYDTGRTALFDNQLAQCVIVARSKEPKNPTEKRFYVLLVASTREVNEADELVYKRVGAGYMLGKFITLEGKGVAAKIV